MAKKTKIPYADVLNIDPGLYELKVNVINPNADRRNKTDWRLRGQFEGGHTVRYVVERDMDKAREEVRSINEEYEQGWTDAEVEERAKLKVRTAIRTNRGGAYDELRRPTQWQYENEDTKTWNKRAGAWNALVSMLSAVEGRTYRDWALCNKYTYDAKYLLERLIAEGVVTLEDLGKAARKEEFI